MLGLVCRFYPMSKVSLAFSKSFQLTMEIVSPCKVYCVLLLSKGEESEYHCARLKMTLRTEHAE